MILAKYGEYDSEVKERDVILIPEVSMFKYPGSIHQHDYEINENVAHKKHAGWSIGEKDWGLLFIAKYLPTSDKFYRFRIIYG